MSKRIAGKPSFNIPFPGFYESILSSEIDSVEERNAEHYAEQQDGDGIAPELRLTASEFGEIFFDVTSYSIAHDIIAKKYCEEFDEQASEALGFKLRLKYEEMTSPKYYNFETDRLFAASTWKAVRELFKLSKADKHKTLAELIRQRFTSRSGFASFYSNDIKVWLAKSVRDWDHNELGTLLLAGLALKGVDTEDIRWKVYYGIADTEAFYNAVDAAVDWNKFEAKVAEARADKLSEIQKDDPGYVPPPERCPLTLDLFKDYAKRGH